MTETTQQQQAELIGHTLDVAVASLEGTDTSSPPPYSTDPAFGQPIIEREKITLLAPFFSVSPEWEAIVNAKANYEDIEGKSFALGPTALIAAMRCYVASRLKD